MPSAAAVAEAPQVEGQHVHAGPDQLRRDVVPRRPVHVALVHEQHPRPRLTGRRVGRLEGHPVGRLEVDVARLRTRGNRHQRGERRSHEDPGSHCSLLPAPAGANVEIASVSAGPYPPPPAVVTGDSNRHYSDRSHSAGRRAGGPAKPARTSTVQQVPASQAGVHREAAVESDPFAAVLDGESRMVRIGESGCRSGSARRAGRGRSASGRFQAATAWRRADAATRRHRRPPPRRTSADGRSADASVCAARRSVPAPKNRSARDERRPRPATPGSGRDGWRRRETR